MLTSKEKTKIIKDFSDKPENTGSAEVQIALISKQITVLVDHLKTHKKDNISRRGLLGMVSKRRSLLDYLSRTNNKSYETVTKKLGLKR